MATRKPPALPTPERIKAGEATQEERLLVFQRAQDGDTAALPALRAMMDRAPGGILVDMAEQASVSLVKAMSGKNLLLEESAMRQMEQVRKRTAGSNPTPLESLLAERIAFCWMSVQHREAAYAQNAKDLSMRQAEHHQRLIDAAHRRYLAAIKALAQVRRLQLPAVQVNQAAQVNIGTQQTNMAATSPAPDTAATSPAALPSTGQTAGALDTMGALLTQKAPATVKESVWP